jgi:imidazole glycerol phosphate synthase subunit HisF
VDTVKKEHFTEVLAAGADAVAFAHVLHYSKVTLPGLRKIAGEYGIPVREIK